jgi:hypothetical protein
MPQATKMAIADQKDVRIRSDAVQTSWRLSIPTKVQKGFSNWEVKNDASKGDDDCESGVLH